MAQMFPVGPPLHYHYARCCQIALEKNTAFILAMTICKPSLKLLAYKWKIRKYIDLYLSGIKLGILHLNLLLIQLTEWNFDRGNYSVLYCRGQRILTKFGIEILRRLVTSVVWRQTRLMWCLWTWATRE